VFLNVRVVGKNKAACAADASREVVERWLPNRHLSQLGKRAMKFVQVGSCKMDSPDAVVANPFFVWRESFFLSEAVLERTSHSA
jgi:hypothetical protein